MTATKYSEPQLVICEELNQLMSYSDVVGFLGGYVQQVRLKTGDVLLVNEDAIRLAMPINEKATVIYRWSLEPEPNIMKLPKLEWQQFYRSGGFNILGNAVLVRKKLAHLLFSDEENTNE